MHRTQETTDVRGWGDPSASITQRQAQAGDQDRLRAFLAGLTPETTYLRFFTFMPSPPGSLVRTLLTQDGQRGSWIAVRDDAVVAHASWSLFPAEQDVADLGLVVADDLQGQGIGTWLAGAATFDAYDAGARCLRFHVLAENRNVLRSIVRRWPDAHATYEGPHVVYDVPIAGDHPRGMSPRTLRRP